MADVPHRRQATRPRRGSDGPAWQRDVRVTTTTALTTTGGTVWGAAHRAVDFFEACAGDIGLARPGVRILELGAGCGLLGLTLARNLPHAAEVCLTEQAAGGALDHLRANVAANAGMPGLGAVTTAACDWTLLQAPGGSGDAGRRGGGGEAAGGEHAADQPQAAAVAVSAIAAAAEAAAVAAAASAAPVGLETTPAGGAAVQIAAAPAPGAAACGGEAAAAADPDMARLLSARWDFVIGSDLVYNEAGTHMLPHVMRALALAGRQQRCSGQQQPQAGQRGSGSSGSSAAQTPRGEEAAAEACQSGSSGEEGLPAACIYYAHTKNRLPACDEAFLVQAAAAGLAVEEVREAAFPSPPPSPPPFTELFPEMRCLVYRATVLPGGCAARGAALTLGLRE
ncbi:hypothetical protein Rsub_12770 [Raphidocelis subcapitata]|uniref:Uncharacterized protein n=1 Tax=Raphidocelis subcapitata TaxID=307507 RepID=A0A2V0PLX5_9CHLO|nr:hypothetical protein Rsub_12770 [Raphidocelis subcapitata]|eukprot:GBG00073.1 hypothetical protein Rsub_12770 [Raphidocelis subcapitata]